MVLSCTVVHFTHISAIICLSLGEVNAFYAVWSETAHLPFNVFYAFKVVHVLLKMNFKKFCAFRAFCRYLEQNRHFILKINSVVCGFYVCEIVLLVLIYEHLRFFFWWMTSHERDMQFECKI